MAHPSRGRWRSAARWLPEREQRIAELEQEIERLRRTEEAIVVATGAPREPPPLRSAFGAGARGEGPSTRHGSGRLSSERRSRPRSAPGRDGLGGYRGRGRISIEIDGWCLSLNFWTSLATAVQLSRPAFHIASRAASSSPYRFYR